MSSPSRARGATTRTSRTRGSAATTRGGSTRAAEIHVDHRPSYLAAAIAGTVVFILYVLTLAPTTAMWDASEYIAAAHVFGIPHPPGNPFFIMLGKFFAILPIAPNVAMRINLLAALSSAVAAGMWFLVTERVLVSWLTERWQRIVAGSAAALIGATAFTVWNQSVVNEKVYTVSLVIFAIVSWLTVRWCDDPDGPTADKLLILIAFLTGIGYSNHPAGFLVLPAVGVAVLMRRPQVLLRWRLIVTCLAVLGLGLTPFAFQPIRAAHFPAMNMGEPTGCTEGIGVACTFSATTYDRLHAQITREQYGKPDLTQRQAPVSAQYAMYWMYFEWQWLRDSYGERPGLQRMLALLFLGLGIAGGVVHWKRDRKSFWFFGPLVFTVTLALVYYMNFKYGWSQSQELQGVEREVRDRDYFYLWSFSTWSVWVALGLTLAWRTVAGLVSGTGAGGDDPPPLARRPWLLASPVLAIALIPLIGNWNDASRSGEHATREWAHDLLNSVEPYGIIITAGDNDTFPLWYAQEVEGIRRDVTVAVTSLLNTDWYPRSLIRRPTYEYDRENGPAIYRDREWPMPSGPAIRMSIAEADAIPPYMSLDRPMFFRHETLVAQVDPQRLERGVLEKADQLVLLMIRDNWGERSVHISRTGGRYGESLGLGDYLLGQGFAYKVTQEPVQPVEGEILQVQGVGWVNIPRTRALWDEVFRGHEALVAQERWVDHASRGIPWVYVATGAMLGEALAATGQREEAERVMAEAMEVADALRLR
jgi:hypothetical protein